VGAEFVEWVIKKTEAIFTSSIYAGSEESLFRRLKTASGESRVEGWSSKALMDGSVTVPLAEDERKGGNISGKEFLRTFWAVYTCSRC
jgi:hypothetical protein